MATIVSLSHDPPTFAFLVPLSDARDEILQHTSTHRSLNALQLRDNFPSPRHSLQPLYRPRADAKRGFDLAQLDRILLLMLLLLLLLLLRAHAGQRGEAEVRVVDVWGISWMFPESADGVLRLVEEVPTARGREGQI